jgi:hypothetical protein
MRVAFAGRRWIRMALFGWLGILLIAGTPTTARANCLWEAISSCNADFGSVSDRLAGIRGWCYMIRWGMCSAFDE